MKLFTAEDFERLIEQLPNDPATQAVYAALMEMRDENSVEKHPFDYEIDFATTITQGTTNVFAAPTAAGALVVTGNFLVDASSPWLWVSQSFQADVAGAAVTLTSRPSPNVVAFITEAASNRNWMNGPVPIPSFFGANGLPYMLPQPRLLPGNSNVQVQVTNYDAASVPNIRLTFHGYRFYSTRKG